jgi:hypothetical protein
MASLDDRRPVSTAFPSTNRDREVTVKTQLRHVLACAVVSALSAFPVLAAENAPKAPTPPAKAGMAPADESQQDRMRRCNATAKEKALKGDERRAFMSSCLKR